MRATSPCNANRSKRSPTSANRIRSSSSRARCLESQPRMPPRHPANALADDIAHGPRRPRRMEPEAAVQRLLPKSATRAPAVAKRPQHAERDRLGDAASSKQDQNRRDDLADARIFQPTCSTMPREPSRRCAESWHAAPCNNVMSQPGCLDVNSPRQNIHELKGSDAPLRGRALACYGGLPELSHGGLSTYSGTSDGRCVLRHRVHNGLYLRRRLSGRRGPRRARALARVIAPRGPQTHAARIHRKQASRGTPWQQDVGLGGGHKAGPRSAQHPKHLPNRCLDRPMSLHSAAQLTIPAFRAS